MDHQDLGNCPPLVRRDHMLAGLSVDIVPNRLFLTLFLCHLPADMRDQLAAQDLFTLEAMVAADNWFFVPRPHGANGCASVSAGGRIQSTEFFCAVMPVSLRQQIFDSLRGMAYPGSFATRWLVSSRFVRPCLAAQVMAWTRRCLDGQRRKVSHPRQTAATRHS